MKPVELHPTLAPLHGGPDAAGIPLHDFSTNSNACGPCPEALHAVQVADATRYPDPAYTALRAGLGAFHGVPPARIVLAASASEFTHRITALAAQWGAVQVAVPPHSYGDYAQAAQARGLALLRGGTTAAAGLQWACEPSSPLGHADPVVRTWQDGGPVAALRVLDCAYAPLRLDEGCTWTGVPAPHLPSACWQLWTPNKALGLTGVRAAYAVAPAGTDAQVLALNALAPSWPVGAHGVAMLQAWIQPAVQQWLVHSLGRLRDWKTRQHGLCADMGWKVQPGSLANYFCALPDGCSQAIAFLRMLAGLRAAGIKLRDCASFGLSGHLRLGVLPPASQDALVTAWRGIQATLPHQKDMA
jgi:histidinol-phosphate aminotransferase